MVSAEELVLQTEETGTKTTGAKNGLATSVSFFPPRKMGEASNGNHCQVGVE